MFSLAEGIFLEDSKKILRWGCSRKEAWRIGKPTRHLPNDETRIKWEEKMLGGQSCTLLAYLPGESVLDEVSIWLTPNKDTYRGEDEIFHYCQLFDELVRQLGSPIIHSSVGGFYAPILTWQHDACYLQLVTGERHGDFTVLEIRKGKEPRYPWGKSAE